MQLWPVGLAGSTPSPLPSASAQGEAGAGGEGLPAFSGGVWAQAAAGARLSPATGSLPRLPDGCWGRAGRECNDGVQAGGWALHLAASQLYAQRIGTLGVDGRVSVLNY